MQSKHDAKAAKRFVAKLTKKQWRVPREMVRYKLKSYGTAHRTLMRSVEHRSYKGLNNRVENLHQPTRQRERAMKYFRSPGGAQRFLAAFSAISLHFQPRRHPMPPPKYHTVVQRRFTLWNQITGITGMPVTV